MKQRHAVALLALVILATAFILLRKNHHERADDSSLSSPPAAPSDAALSSPAPPLTPEQKAAPGVASTRPKEELAAIAAMSQVLADFARPDRSMNDLLDALKAAHQEPFVAKTENPYTGTLQIVRTNSPMLGTRYFHAQYFSGPETPPQAQHMSFEIRAGDDALAVAQNAVTQAFHGLGEPAVKTDKFMQWDLPDGYVVWIKLLEANDLEGNPFNAYTEKDIGSPRIAVELKPENDSD